MAFLPTNAASVRQDSTIYGWARPLHRLPACFYTAIETGRIRVMALLRVDLQEGFRDDPVVVLLDSLKICDKVVSTRLQTGFASSCEAEITPGPHALTISLPRRNLAKVIDITTNGLVTTYIGISLSRSGDIEHKISEQEFGYL